MATPIKMYTGQPAATNTTLYTANTSQRVRILAATITNEGSTPRTITFHLVPSGDSVSDANIILNAQSLGDSESYVIAEIIGHILEGGDFLSAIAEAADELTVHISGVIL